MISLPQGRNPPTYHPTSVTAQPVDSTSETAVIPHDPHLAAVTIAAHHQLSALENQALSSIATTSSPPKPRSSSRSAASSLFIPRTSHNSQGIRKPLNKCSLSELNTMLERNKRVIESSQSTARMNPATLKRLNSDLEEIGIRIQQLENAQSIKELQQGMRLSSLNGNGNGKGKERELDYQGAMSDINSKSLDQALSSLRIDPKDPSSPPRLSRAAQMELRREETLVSASCGGVEGGSAAAG